MKKDACTSAPGGVSQGWRRGVESPPSNCWPHFFSGSSGYGWLSELHPDGSCQASHPPESPRPSQDCSHSSWFSNSFHLEVINH